MTYLPSRYVPGCVVKYRGPTDTQGSKWTATIRRGSQREDVFRASVAYNEGHLAAAQAAVEKINQKMDFDWIVLSFPQSIDGGNSYSYPVGPAEMRIYYNNHPIS
jgi:hypothetical protein